MTNPKDEPFWHTLHRRGEAVALIEKGVPISYAELAARADEWVTTRRQVLPSAVQRPLVCLEFPRSAAAISAYLGCLRAGWPVIPVAEGEARSDSAIVQVFQPNIIQRWNGAAEVIETTAATQAQFCDDLAVLLSTSGTTGASKLVKLSGGNIDANARSIIEYLGLTPEETAITTLPLHYSFGLSVLHSHLGAGARIVVTDAPLTEPAFWEEAAKAGVTSLAMVPTQYELLERIGFSESWLPRLTCMTQAGGRLDPILARAFAQRAAKWGWRLVLMYGQTEASPRIAYLPPEDALEHPDKIGRPIPGGRLWLADAEGREVTSIGVTGELVYAGPNVMIGYALRRSDLALPKDTFELRTGDIAERTESGHFRIVGRSSRFIKLNGLRVGLDEVETVIRATGRKSFASGDDRGLVVFVTEAGGEAALSGWLAERLHVAHSAVTVRHLPEPPMLASGKVDYRGLRVLAEAVLSEDRPTASDEGLIQAVARILRQPDIDSARSFRELGGDSLAFLEVELYLTKNWGQVPDGWETVPIGVLAKQRTETGDAKGRWAAQRIGIDVPIRVLAIFWVLMLHASVITHGGGVYVLAALAGYSFARHQSTQLLSGEVSATVVTMLRPLVICYLGILAVLTINFSVDWRWFALIANFWVAQENAPPPDFLVPYWFVSTYVQSIVLVSLCFLAEPVRRRVRTDPFRFGVTVTLCLSLAVALLPLVSEQGGLIRLPDGFLVLFGIGWCISCAKTTWQRVEVSAIVVSVWFVCWSRIDLSVDFAVLLGLALVIWLPKVNLPGPIARLLRELAALTMFIYLMHVPLLYLDFYLMDTRLVIFVATAIFSVIAAIVARWVYQRVEFKLVERLTRVRNRAEA